MVAVVTRRWRKAWERANAALVCLEASFDRTVKLECPIRYSKGWRIEGQAFDEDHFAAASLALDGAPVEELP